VRIGGRRARFELITADDGADSQRGVAAARQLVDQRVIAVVGHLNSGASIPASRVYAEAGIAQISPSSTNPKYTRQGFPTTFRLIADDVALAITLGRYALQSLNARSVAVVDDRTAYGQAMADEFERGVREAGGRVMTREYTHEKATDFTAIVTSLKARQTDLVFFGGMDTVAGPLLRQMRQMGVQARLLGGDGICSGELPKLAQGTTGDHQVFCAEAGGTELDKSAAMTDFKARFRRRFGADVQIYAPYTYDAVMLIADAMVRARSSDAQSTLMALREARFQGLTGPISFDARGDLVSGVASIHTYVGGRRTAVGRFPIAR
jgi:branched-chain amino acid transport system substrate-binding protein